MRVLVPPALLSPCPPRRTMRGKVCDRRKKWTTAIMEFRATRVVLLPPPQRSLVQRQLCWMNQREKERERKRVKKKKWKSEMAGKREREGAFTTSGLDFFFSLFSTVPLSAITFLPVCSSPMHLQRATRYSSPWLFQCVFSFSSYATGARDLGTIRAEIIDPYVMIRRRRSLCQVFLFKISFNFVTFFGI